MANHKVSYVVVPWAQQYKAQIKVDGYDTERAFFDSYRQAEAWAKAKVKELQAALTQ